MKYLSARRLRTLASLLVTAAVAVACGDATGPDSGDPAYARHGPAQLEVWWPTEGAVLSGAQPFKARLEDWKLQHYDMQWAVDGGTPTYMADNWDDASHKEAVVDVDTWSWNGSGPYAVRFTARDRKGKLLSDTVVQVYVQADSTVVPPPPPPDSTATTGNPLTSAPLWVDPYSHGMRQIEEWRDARPEDAAQLEKIAYQPQAIWFGNWSGDIRAAVDAKTTAITSAGALPVYVAYNIPVRDCSSYSGGGAPSADAYRAWITGFAEGIGARAAVVVLEPDALAGLDCLDGTRQAERLALLAEAVAILKANAGTAVYLDAGHSAWHSAAEMARRLGSAGIAAANGFSLNVSNFQTTAASVTYGKGISAAVGGKHFVIDTSRNGLGPTVDNQWCNPDGRALGYGPGTATGHEQVDAFLWIKRPGESDGTCNGGPSAGAWWADYALGLAERTPALIAYGG